MKLKELLDIAKGALSEVITVENPDFRLEEVKYDQDNKLWDITVSYLAENTNEKTSSFHMITSPMYKYERIYKRLTIDEDKNITGLYIFEKA